MGALLLCPLKHSEGISVIYQKWPTFQEAWFSLKPGGFWVSGVGKGLEVGGKGGGPGSRDWFFTQQLVLASPVTGTQASLTQGELRRARAQMILEGDGWSLRGAGPQGPYWIIPEVG